MLLGKTTSSAVATAAWKICTSAAYVLHVCRLDLVPCFFEFLSLQHSNNNVHNIRLCRLVIANADLSSQELADMRVAEKVRTLFKLPLSIPRPKIILWVLQKR